MSWESMLEEMQAELREFVPTASGNDWNYLRMVPPGWLDKRDELWPLIQNQDFLLKEGTVVWGRIVQANSLLFKPDLYRDCPATVIFSEDPNDAHPPEVLDEIAEDLFRLKKRTTFEDGEQQRYGHMLADEMIRGVDWYAPTSLSQGRKVRSTTILLPRKHLLAYHLARSTFPILIHPSVPTVVLLPERFWAEPFRKWWMENADPSPPEDPLPRGALGMLKRIYYGGGFFTTMLGWFVLLLMIGMVFVIADEAKFHFHGPAKKVEDPADLAKLEHSNYVQFQAPLNYEKEVVTGWDDHFVPVLGAESDVIIFQHELDVGPAKPPGTLETIEGRLVKGKRGEWDIGPRDYDVEALFKDVNLVVSDPVVIVSNEHPGLGTWEIIVWSVVGTGWFLFFRRMGVAVRMLRDDQLCYQEMSRRDDD